MLDLELWNLKVDLKTYFQVTSSLSAFLKENPVL